MKKKKLILISLIMGGFLFTLIVIFSLPVYREYKLMQASANGDIEAIRSLINSGVDVNSRYGSDGYTPLYLATSSENEKVIAFLLKNGSNPNITGDGGENPLMTAAFKGYSNVVKMLVSHGADVNFQEDRDGYTPLHVAAMKGHTQIVNILLEHGADTSLKTIDGMTPSDKARAAGFQDIAGTIDRCCVQKHIIQSPIEDAPLTIIDISDIKLVASDTLKLFSTPIRIIKLERDDIARLGEIKVIENDSLRNSHGLLVIVSLISPYSKCKLEYREYESHEKSKVHPNKYWYGGFISPCHGDSYDLLGRAIPPGQFSPNDFPNVSRDLDALVIIQ